MEEEELGRRLEVLGECEQLAGLPPRLLQALALGMDILEYRRGQVLFYQQEVAQHLYFNQSGAIDLRYSYIPTADASELALRKLMLTHSSGKQPGLISDSKVVKKLGAEPFGLEAIDQHRYRTKAICKTHGFLYRLPLSLVRQALRQSPQPSPTRTKSPDPI
jgi:hypothetical protein